MQTSFAAGEVSPTLFGRVDLDKYHIGLQVCRNAFVDYRGGITNRPGTRLVGPVLDSNFQNRLIPFTFSTVQTYILVFGELSMRVVQEGGFVTEPAKAMSRSGTTYTVAAHGYATGDWISVSDLVQPARVTVTGSNTFTLSDIYTGAAVTSNATSAARIFTLVTPWHSADLAMLKYTQSFDTMTLTHPSYTPYNLTRTQHWVWNLTPITFAATILPPTNVSAGFVLSGAPPVGTTVDTGYGYLVTSVSDSGEESVGSVMFTVQSLNMETLPVTATVIWDAVAGAKYYNVYRTSICPGKPVVAGATVGYIGYSVTNSFNDANMIPDFVKAPPTHENPFEGSNFPGVSTYFDQRKTYAASKLNPQTLWFSRPGQYNNFDTSQPANDGDALTYTLAATQSAAIRSMVSMPDGLLAFTQSGVYKISGGGQNTGIKVTGSVARAQNYIGASDVMPIPINFEILFVQDKGSIVRSLTYNFYTTTYEPLDITLISNHLFSPGIITEWTHAEHPNKIIWCVQSDGRLLALTYLKDQKISGWTRHDTEGSFESVASVQENHTDTVYFVVRRNIKGTWFRFVEQLQTKDISGGLENAWYVDCGLDYGLGTPAATATFSAPTGNARVIADAPVFGSGDVGKILRAAKGIATVTSFIDSTHLGITWNQDPTDLIYNIPVPDVRAQAPGDWTLTAKVTTVSGLNHLAGEDVSYLSDGVPGTGTVALNGTFTVPVPASRIIVGFGYFTQCQTLSLEPSGPSIQGKRKRITAVVARVQDTGVLKYGPNFDELTPWIDVYGNQLNGGIMTGEQPLGVNQFYDYGGRVAWQQDLPLPMTVLSLVPQLSVGD